MNKKIEGTLLTLAIWVAGLLAIVLILGVVGTIATAQTPDAQLKQLQLMNKRMIDVINQTNALTDRVKYLECSHRRLQHAFGLYIESPNFTVISKTYGKLCEDLPWVLISSPPLDSGSGWNRGPSQ